MLNKEPYGNKIIVSILESQEVKSSGGLILSSDSVPIGKVGRVEAVGPKCEQARVGRNAIYPENAGFELFIDGIKYRTIQEYDVIYFEDTEESKLLYEDRIFNAVKERGF